MLNDMLRVLLDFHRWQGEQLLDAAAQVPAEVLASTPLNDRTLWETLRHIVDVSYSWRCAAEGLPVEGMAWDVAPLEDLPALRAFWMAEADRLLELVLAWGEDDLAEQVTPSWRREPFARWQMVLHVVTHQSDQASEVAWALTRLGRSPGEVGFMRYVHTHRGDPGLEGLGYPD